VPGEQPAVPPLIIAANVDQQGAHRLRGEGIGRPGTMRQRSAGLSQQIIHGHLIFPFAPLVSLRR